MEVLLIVEVEGLEDKELFDKHLKEEGFDIIDGEEFAYNGTTTTSLLHTQTFILHVTKEALKKAGFSTCKIIFQIGENPMEAYKFSKKSNEFLSVDI
jgi:hypothetical protein